MKKQLSPNHCNGTLPHKHMPFSMLTDDDFFYFRDIVYRETGIKLSDAKKALLQSRIMKRLRALTMKDFHDYRIYLQHDYDSEVLHLINVVTTNKTEFMREKRHFDYLLSSALPEMERNAIPEIRVWSAGCSTGEEPYSIAITCREFFGNSNKPLIKILATDIDTQVLKTAYLGEYNSTLVEIFDPRYRKKYFNINGHISSVRDEIKSMVYFRRLNLLLDSYPMNRKFLIIFCRNVIIYFDKPTQRRLFGKIYDYLDDDGYLFIGHSENLSGISDKFISVGHTIYRKRL